MRFDFDSTRAIRGLALGFEQRNNITTAATTFECNSIGLLYSRVSSSYSNFASGVSTAFWVERKELENILTKKELVFLNSIILQRSDFGDFIPAFLEHDELENISDWTAAMEDQRISKTRFLLVSEKEIAILADYNFKSIYNVLNNLLVDDQEDIYTKFLFQDQSLKTQWSNLRYELMSIIVVQVPDPDKEDGTLISKSVGVIPDPLFGNDSELRVYSDKTNHIFRVSNFTTTYDLQRDDSIKNEVRIYFSFSSIKHLAELPDRIILETLLQEIVE